MLSALLSDLVGELTAKEINVKATCTRSDGTTFTTEGGPEVVVEVTDLPTGHKVLVVQYVRESKGFHGISNLDILSVDVLGVDIVFLVFGATATEYQVDILTRDASLMESTFALLIDRLSLEEIEPS